MSPLIPSHLKKIVPYEPGKPIEELQRELGISDIIKLASNESPFGPPEVAIEAIKHSLNGLNRYPDDSYYVLKYKIGEKFGVAPKNITVGSGSSELIVFSARALLGHNDYAVISEQTFISYWLAVQSVNGNLIRVPLRNYTYDLEAMSAAISDRVRLVFIANPNNPTGTMVTAAQMDRFMDNLPEHVVVVYDEAYREYIDDPTYPNPMKYFQRGDRIIILRTFSKIYGLAGLRVGYAIANDQLTDALARVRGPFNVSIPAAAAAAAALDADDHVKEVVRVNNEGKKYLTEELTKLGLTVVPSHANFVLVDFGADTRELNLALQRQGVIVRPMTAFGMPTALRITIGLTEENERVVRSLRNILVQS